MAALVFRLAISLGVDGIPTFCAHAVKLCCVCLAPVAAASSGRLRCQSMVRVHHVLSDFLLMELKVIRIRVCGGDNEPNVPGNSQRKPLKTGLGPCKNSVKIVSAEALRQR